ncbi:ankyrin repeat domain-containing protein [Actimicrobium sp. CCC2.4]|uniref:ankyrin repeat domain-containing protein n=1 Tax=Actimicrobium sp. CCC2.4 TaxID=3048606 RepID=UPI002AC91664|nr:ankyrin repeat domain-containing protein [Actimicrobium sp. CCC2.4]MEB0137203.1 ankyrin repeat domain-containing protein [Actimicrobium sp. CCC2.4]WPX32500.1 ankyrin repeat domain-containing protein [Actimicrobium sp. CCC2.4]
MHESATRAGLCCCWGTPATRDATPATAPFAVRNTTATGDIQDALAILNAPSRNGDATGLLLARAIIDGNAIKFAAAMTLAKHGVIDLNQPFLTSSRASMLLELVNKPNASRAGVEFPASEFITPRNRITAMVAHGADPDHPHFSGARPLEVAWRQGTPEGNEVAQALLDAGANPLKHDGDGLTMLHRAVLGDNMNLINNWHAAGLPSDAVSREHRVTPLMLAASENNLPATRALLAGGANVIAPCEGGQTPYSLALDHAMNSGDDRMARLLQQHALASGIPEAVLELVVNRAR